MTTRLVPLMENVSNALDLFSNTLPLSRKNYDGGMAASLRLNSTAEARYVVGILSGACALSRSTTFSSPLEGLQFSHIEKRQISCSLKEPTGLTSELKEDLKKWSRIYLCYLATGWKECATPSRSAIEDTGLSSRDLEVIVARTDHEKWMPRSKNYNFEVLTALVSDSRLEDVKIWNSFDRKRQATTLITGSHKNLHKLFDRLEEEVAPFKGPSICSTLYSRQIGSREYFTEYQIAAVIQRSLCANLDEVSP